jgi:hypothetical protein
MTVTGGYMSVKRWAVKRRCPNCRSKLTAYKKYRVNYPHGRVSNPEYSFRRVKFVCHNPKCPHRDKKKRAYTEYSDYEEDYYADDKGE